MKKKVKKDVLRRVLADALLASVVGGQLQTPEQHLSDLVDDSNNAQHCRPALSGPIAP